MCLRLGRIDVILIIIVIIQHQVGLLHDSNLEVFVILHLFLLLEFQRSKVILVVLVSLQSIVIFILSKDSAVFLQDVCPDFSLFLLVLYLVIRSVYFLYLLFVFLLYDHVQFILFLRKIVGQEHLQSHLHALARRFVNALNVLLCVLASEHIVNLVDISFVLGREFGIAVFSLLYHWHFGLDLLDLYSLAFLHGIDDHKEKISVAFGEEAFIHDH